MYKKTIKNIQLRVIRLLNYRLIIIEGVKNSLKLCDWWKMKQKKHRT